MRNIFWKIVFTLLLGKLSAIGKFPSYIQRECFFEKLVPYLGLNRNYTDIFKHQNVKQGRVSRNTGSRPFPPEAEAKNITASTFLEQNSIVL